MRNLQIYAVQEMSTKEMRETEGGVFTLLARFVARTATIYKYKTEIKQGIDAVLSLFKR